MQFANSWKHHQQPSAQGSERQPPTPPPKDYPRPSAQVVQHPALEEWLSSNAPGSSLPSSTRMPAVVQFPSASQPPAAQPLPFMTPQLLPQQRHTTSTAPRTHSVVQNPGTNDLTYGALRHQPAVQIAHPYRVQQRERSRSRSGSPANSNWSPGFGPISTSPPSSSTAAAFASFHVSPLPMPLSQPDPHLEVSQSWSGTPSIWASLETLHKNRRGSGTMLDAPPVPVSPELSAYALPRRVSVGGGTGSANSSPMLQPIHSRSASMPIRYGPDLRSTAGPQRTAGRRQRSPLVVPQRAASAITSQPNVYESPPSVFSPRRQGDILQNAFESPKPWTSAERTDSAGTMHFASGSSAGWGHAPAVHHHALDMALIDPSLLPSLGIENPPGVGAAYGASPSPDLHQLITASLVRRAYSVEDPMAGKPSPPRIVHQASSAPIARPPAFYAGGKSDQAPLRRPARTQTTESILSGSSSGTIVVASSGDIVPISPTSSGSVARGGSGDISYLLSRMAAVGVGTGNERFDATGRRRS